MVSQLPLIQMGAASQPCTGPGRAGCAGYVYFSLNRILSFNLNLVFIVLVSQDWTCNISLI